MSSKRRRTTARSFPARKHQVDKRVFSYAVAATSVEADNIVIPAQTSPSTVQGFRAILNIQNTTTTTAGYMAWAVIIARNGETPTINAAGNGPILANDKDMFCGDLIPLNLTSASLPAPILRIEAVVKTSRRIKVGDRVWISIKTSQAGCQASVGVTVVGFEVH